MSPSLTPSSTISGFDKSSSLGREVDNLERVSSQISLDPSGRKKNPGVISSLRNFCSSAIQSSNNFFTTYLRKDEESLQSKAEWLGKKLNELEKLFPDIQYELPIEDNSASRPYSMPGSELEKERQDCREISHHRLIISQKSILSKLIPSKPAKPSLESLNLSAIIPLTITGKNSVFSLLEEVEVLFRSSKSFFELWKQEENSVRKTSESKEKSAEQAFFLFKESFEYFAELCPKLKKIRDSLEAQGYCLQIENHNSKKQWSYDVSWNNKVEELSKTLKKLSDALSPGESKKDQTYSEGKAPKVSDLNEQKLREIKPVRQGSASKWTTSLSLSLASTKMESDAPLSPSSGMSSFSLVSSQRSQNSAVSAVVSNSVSGQNSYVSRGPGATRQQSSSSKLPSSKRDTENPNLGGQIPKIVQLNLGETAKRRKRFGV